MNRNYSFPVISLTVGTVNTLIVKKCPKQERMNASSSATTK